MTKVIKFTGIDCANCAQKLENKLNKIDGVEANISFVAGKMILDIDSLDKLIKVEQVCKKMEPEIELFYE